jgi:hypothetical protein
MLRRVIAQSDDGKQIGADILQKRREKAGEFREYWKKTFTGAKAAQWRSDLLRLARNGKIKTGRP